MTTYIKSEAIKDASIEGIKIKDEIFHHQRLMKPLHLKVI